MAKIQYHYGGSDSAYSAKARLLTKYYKIYTNCNFLSTYTEKKHHAYIELHHNTKYIFSIDF